MRTAAVAALCVAVLTCGCSALVFLFLVASDALGSDSNTPPGVRSEAVEFCAAVSFFEFVALTGTAYVVFVMKPSKSHSGAASAVVSPATVPALAPDAAPTPGDHHTSDSTGRRVAAYFLRILGSPIGTFATAYMFLAEQLLLPEDTTAGFVALFAIRLVSCAAVAALFSGLGDPPLAHLYHELVWGPEQPIKSTAGDGHTLALVGIWLLDVLLLASLMLDAATNWAAFIGDVLRFSAFKPPLQIMYGIFSAWHSIAASWMSWRISKRLLVPAVRRVSVPAAPRNPRAFLDLQASATPPAHTTGPHDADTDAVALPPLQPRVQRNAAMYEPEYRPAQDGRTPRVVGPPQLFVPGGLADLDTVLQPVPGVDEPDEAPPPARLRHVPAAEDHGSMAVEWGAVVMGSPLILLPNVALLLMDVIEVLPGAVDGNPALVATVTTALSTAVVVSFLGLSNSLAKKAVRRRPPVTSPYGVVADAVRARQAAAAARPPPQRRARWGLANV